MNEKKLQTLDINISLINSLSGTIKKAIEICKINNIIPQEFDYHIESEQTFHPENINPKSIFFVFQRMNSTSLYDNDVIPVMLYVYVNNNYLDYAKLITDTIVDMNSGAIKETYITYRGLDGKAYTELLNKDIKDFEKEHEGKIDTKEKYLYSWLSETFEKSTVMNNMIPAGINYYATLYMTTTFVINKNVLTLDINKLEYYPNGENTLSKDIENIELIEATLSFKVVLDSQPFYQTKEDNNAIEYNDFVESKAKYGVFTLNLAVPAKNNAFLNKILSIIMAKNKKNKNEPNIDSDFYFKYYLINGEENFNNVFKLSDFNYSKRLNEGDVITLSFTN